MKQLLVLSFLTLITTQNTMAQESDLVLPGEKWIAKFSKYVCSDAGTPVNEPEALRVRGVKFETITTDSTLDNGLIKATFTEDGALCRYSAILLADNALKTIRLVESKAYAKNGASSCEEGKSILDAALEDNSYLYYGHPHNIAIMVPLNGAEEVCNGGNVGVNFVVSGRVK